MFFCLDAKEPRLNDTVGQARLNVHTGRQKVKSRRNPSGTQGGQRLPMCNWLLSRS
jgi:hypothetical protein